MTALLVSLSALLADWIFLLITTPSTTNGGAVTDYDTDEAPEFSGRPGWEPAPPAPRRGDQYTAARMIINAARLVMPAGQPHPVLVGVETTEKRREVIADFLREHGVPVPAGPLPTQRGWLNCHTGEVVDPRETDGRRHV